MLIRIRRNGLRLLSTGTLVIGLLYVLVAWGSASQIEPYQQGWVVAYPVVLFVQQTVGWLALAALGVSSLLGARLFWRDYFHTPLKIPSTIPPLALVWVLILGSAVICIAAPQIIVVSLLILLFGIGLLIFLNLSRTFWVGVALSATVVGCALLSSSALLTGFESLEHEASVSFHNRSYILATLTSSAWECTDRYLVVLACDSINFICRAEWQSSSYYDCMSIDIPIPADSALFSDEAADKLYIQLDGERIEIPVEG
jgi:hypothetical protein